MDVCLMARNGAIMLGISLIVACGSNNSDSGPETIENNLPTVSAGLDQTVDEFSNVSLSATATDSDGTISSYAWIQTGGTAVTLSATDKAEVSFTAPGITAEETLSFSVTVTDNDGDSAADTVEIFVSPLTAAIKPLNDTGITLCGDYAYDATMPAHNNDVDCALTSDDDGDQVPVGQDGHYGRDVNTSAKSNEDGSVGFSFTKLNAVGGGDLAANATEWGCVRDEVTGLIWEVKNEDGNLGDKSHTFTWYNSTGTNDGGFEGYGDTGTSTTTDAGQTGSDNCHDDARCDTEKYVVDINAMAEPLCDYTDWRLPTREELRSIVDYSRSNPAIDADYFPFTLNTWYRSSSPSAGSSGSAWVLNFYYGYDSDFLKYSSFSVRLVRGQ